MMPKPLVSAPVPAVVGMATIGIAGCDAVIARALAASMVQPPPSATIAAGPNSRAAAAPSSTVEADGFGTTPSYTAVFRACRVGAAIGTFLLPLSLDHFGVGRMLIAAAVLAVGGAVSQFLGPETNGLTLTQTVRKSVQLPE
jgi:hypothetical protein